MGDAPARYARDRRLRHLPAADRAGRAAAGPRRDRSRRPSCSTSASPSSRASSASSARTPRRCSPAARPPTRSSPRSRAASPRSRRGSLHARHRALRGAARWPPPSASTAQVLAGRPTSSQVRVALAEALLHQRRYVDASAEAGAVPGDDAFAPLAARIELWGSLAGEDLARADRRSGEGRRSRRAGVAARGVRRVGIAAGPDQAPRQLPVAATPLLGAILETLLSTQDFKTFELLAGLIEHSALPEREQREMRASMYLRVGLLAQAAQEWMAICESAPDGARAGRPGPRVRRAWRRRGRRRVRDRSLEPGAHQRSGPGDPGPLRDRRRRVIPGGLTRSTHGDIEQTCNTSLKLSIRRPITAPEPEHRAGIGRNPSHPRRNAR